MSNPTLSNRKLAIVRSSDFKAQAAYGTPISTANLNYWQPQTTPAGHGIIPFREQTRDCSGENILIEQLTGKIARFTITFNATAKALAGWFAYLQSVAGAPAGTPADETQTLTFGGATAGGFKANLTLEGVTSISRIINYDDTNAVIKAKLEAMGVIGAGNVTVTGTTTKTITFVNNLRKANISLMTVSDDTTTGGTGVVIAAGSNGANNVAQITRTTSEKPVLFSLIEGFKDTTDGYAKRYQDLVVGDWTVRAPRRGIVSLTVVAFGDPTAEVLSGYTIPACVTEAPLKTRDVRFKIGSTWITDDLRELTYTESNAIDVSEDALQYVGLTPDQLERGDRTASINVLSLGLPTAAMYTFAEDEDNAFAASEIHLGPPGERLSIFNPNTQFRLDDGLIEFVGTKNKSAFRLLGRPSPDGSGVISRGQYTGDFAGTFLATS